MDVAELKQSDVRAAAALLSRALFQDASSVYHFPDEETRLSRLNAFHAALLETGLRNGVVYATQPELAGIALWMPPGSERISLRGKLTRNVVAAASRFGLVGMRRVRGSMKIMEKVHSEAVPGKHWYLVVVGVDPDHQGKGVGSTLMKHALHRADLDGLPSYLETTRKASRKTFQQFGFASIGDAVGVRGLPAWPMVRPPQSMQPDAK